MEHAHRRGMDCVITATLTEFPPEFASLLSHPQKIQQLGEMTIVPGPETKLTDPGLIELASAVLRATVNTYPEADLVALGMPEFRQWAGHVDEAWSSLDRKYGVAKIRTLENVRKADVTDHTVTVIAPEAEEALAPVVSRANELGIKIRSVELREPNLEAVFLHLTGRALRDQ